MRARPWILLLGLFLVLLIVGSSCAPKPAAAPTYTFKLNSWLAKETSYGEVIDWYAAEIGKRTAGKVKIEVYHGGALGGPRESFDLTKKGVIDIAVVGTTFVLAEFPLGATTVLPYITSSPDASMLAMNELYKTYAPFREEFEAKNNVRLVLSWAVSPTMAGSKKPFTKMEDIPGKKWRGVGHYLGVIKMLGGTPVPTQTGELYEALQRGTVDGYIGWPYDYIWTAKLQEVAPYVVDWQGGIHSTTFFVMNMDTWKKLPPDIQKAFDKVMEDSIPVITDSLIKWDGIGTKGMQAANVNFYKLPPEEIARWKAKVLPTLWDDWLKQTDKPGTPTKEFLAKYQDLVKKYEPKSRYIHPFPK
ncbi:MAG: C4-dicarboxylate transporter substrate-binding protein [Dehalococcoidia bacterium]|nr:C4-dicarboxylate transporter substrate-binding protein [Dehalococcoidia bacterium]